MIGKNILRYGKEKKNNRDPLRHFSRGILGDILGCSCPPLHQENCNINRLVYSTFNKACTFHKSETECKFKWITIEYLKKELVPITSRTKAFFFLSTKLLGETMT